MSIFNFKHFKITQAVSSMKVGTDAMLLGSMIQANDAKWALDVGAGTGVISLMVAQNYQVTIDAVELDELSFRECQFNFENSPWRERLNAQQADFILFETLKKYDLIFSNPPYYQTKLENANRREAQAKHERSLPMLPFIEKLDNVLADTGEIWLIVPFIDGDKWTKGFIEKQIHLNSTVNISGKRGDAPNRSVLKFSRKKTSVLIKDFTVREKDGKYSLEYIALTEAFHANKLG